MDGAGGMVLSVNLILCKSMDRIVGTGTIMIL